MKKLQSQILKPDFMEKTRLKTLLSSSLLFLLCLIIILSGSLSHSVAALRLSGVATETIYLTEILPFIGLFLAISRVIIGFNVPNIFVPIVIILTSFVMGIGLTLEVMLISLALAYLGKYLISEFHLHFSVKISLIISIVTVGLILALPILRNSNLFQATDSHLIIVYGLLIISIINEKFISFKMTKSSFVNDFKSILNTVLFSTICFLLLGGKLSIFTLNLEWLWLKNIIQTFPESIFAAFFLIISIGRYTGLRLTEVIRFRKLIFKSN